MTPHPRPDELADFLAGRLPPPRSREIDAHLEECEACSLALPPREPLSPAPETPLLPPGYDLIEEIGRGGMGVVYRARRHADGLEFAIKTLLPEFRRNAGYLEHEAAITSRIRHLRVLNGARLRRYSDTDPTPFIEFPWVPGTTLAKMIGTPLALEHPLRLVRWVRQCCQAVAAAHRHDPPIIHFDLKPENILVYDRDGEAVLIDFGLASEWPPPPGVSRTGCGTPAYMAPEVAAGRADQIGPRTDVFALGGILCAVLTGQPPYDKRDFGDTAGVTDAARDANLAPAFRRLDAVRDHRPLAAFAKRCLSPDPADRPADAEEVWRELDRLSVPRRRFPRPRWRIVLLLAGLLAACVTLALILRDRPPTKDELLTAGPWARFIKFGSWSAEQKTRIEADFVRRKLPPRKFGPLHDAAGNVIMPCDVGAYPLVRFHRPEWVETVSLSHNATLDRPPPTESDYHHVLPPLPGVRVAIPLPTEPGWEKGVTGDRACKKPLTVTVAFTNAAYIFPPAIAAGGLAVGTEAVFLDLHEIGNTATGRDEDARGAGSRSFVAVWRNRQAWDAATEVKLLVKVRGVRDVYEYDLHPRKLGWEKGIRDGEAE